MDTSTEYCVVERIDGSTTTERSEYRRVFRATGESNVRYFDTERDAREYFNLATNGFNVVELWVHRIYCAHLVREMIVASRCPILMIA